jgi:hypothetical protein
VLAPASKRHKRKPSGGALGEWVRGQGLWILDAVGLAAIVIGTFLTARAGLASESAPLQTGFLLGYVCGLAIVMPLALAIGAVFLRLACRLANVDAPEYIRCMGIVLLVASVQWLINHVVSLIVGPINPQQADAGAIVLGVIINLAVGAAASIPVLMVTLDISAGRAALVWVIEILLAIALVILVTLLIVGLVLALGLSRASG